MKLRDGGSTVLIILGIVVILGLVSQRWLGPDNPVEESAEVVIEQHTGVDLDLSPGTPER